MFCSSAKCYTKGSCKGYYKGPLGVTTRLECYKTGSFKGYYQRVDREKGDVLIAVFQVSPGRALIHGLGSWVWVYGPCIYSFVAEHQEQG